MFYFFFFFGAVRLPYVYPPCPPSHLSKAKDLSQHWSKISSQATTHHTRVPVDWHGLQTAKWGVYKSDWLAGQIWMVIASLTVVRELTHCLSTCLLCRTSSGLRAYPTTARQLTPSSSTYPPFSTHAFPRPWLSFQAFSAS